MKKGLAIVIGISLLVLLLMVGCSNGDEPAAAPAATPKPPVLAQATATPVPPAAPTATPVPSTAPAAAPVVSEKVAPMGAMLAALDIMDSAGFHGMTGDLELAAEVFMHGPGLGTYAGLDAIGGLGLHGLSQSLEAMTDASEISSRTAGSIANVAAVINAVTWSEELSAEVAALQEDLGPLRVALVAADLAAAQVAVHEAHETAHDLSVAAYEWLGEQTGQQSSGAVAVLGTWTGLDAIGGLGLHGLSGDLEAMTDASEISSRTAGNVANVLAVMSAVTWSEELSAEVAALQEDLGPLRGALVAADLAAAQVAVHEAHETAHDLSVASYEWLGEQTGQQGSGAVAVLGTRTGLDAIGGLGLHGLSGDLEAMTDASEISSRTAGSIANAMAVVSAVTWSEDLSAEVAALREDLGPLREALVAADLAAAQAAVHEAHETAHDLSVAAYEWLGEQDGVELMSTLISSRTLGTVRNVNTAVKAVPWEGEMQDLSEALSSDLSALADALARNDVVASAEAAGPVHSAQHDFSVGIYEWVALQATGGAASGHTAEAGTGTVIAAIDIVDSAGFHDLGEAIEAATSPEDIGSRDARKVHNVRNVVAAVAWPAGISQEAQSLLDDLSALDEALTAADLHAAKEAAEGVHGTQHNLSVASYDWLATQKATGSDVGALLATTDLIGTAGFHGMAVAHAAAASHDDISTRDARTIKHVLVAAEAVAWPSDIGAEAQAFIHDLAAHDAAMAAGDLMGCQAAAEAVHHTQHDLSEAVWEWQDSQSS